jgi:hypothetical protein
MRFRWGLLRYFPPAFSESAWARAQSSFALYCDLHCPVTAEDGTPCNSLIHILRNGYFLLVGSISNEGRLIDCLPDIPWDNNPLFSISYWIRNELRVLLRWVNIRNWLSAVNLWKYGINLESFYRTLSGQYLKIRHERFDTHILTNSLFIVIIVWGL